MSITRIEQKSKHQRLQLSLDFRRPPSNFVGVGWAAIAVGVFAFIYISGKLTGSQASALQIMWLRYVGGLVSVLILLPLFRTPLSDLKTSQAHIHALRAASGGLGGVAAVYAAANMPVVSASAIGLMDGVFTIALGVLLLQERISGRQCTAAGVCLLGAIVVVLGKGALNSLDAKFMLPALVALAGAFSEAVESILIKRLARSERILPVLFYVNLFGALLFAIPGLVLWSDVPWTHIGLFLSLGPLAIAAQSCKIKALRHSDVVVIGPVRYLWIVYGMVFGWLLFGEKLTLTSVAGASFVLAGGLWLALSKKCSGISRVSSSASGIK